MKVLSRLTTAAGGARTWGQAGLLLLTVGTLLIPQFLASAQGQAADPQALAAPIIDTPAHFRAARAKVWRQGSSQMLLLDRDVEITIGTYGFRARRAVVRIDQQYDARLLYVYLDDAAPLAGKGATQVQAPRLLVTVTTTGNVELATDLLEPQGAAGDPLVLEAQQRIGDHLQRLQTPMLSVPSTARDESGDKQTARAAAAARLRAAEPQIIVPEPTAPARLGAAPTSAPTTTTSPAGSAASTADSTPPTVAPGTADSATTTTALLAGGSTGSTGETILPRGMVNFSFQRMVVEGEGEEKVALLFGQVGVMFTDPQSGRSMSLTAQNAVVFLAADQVSSPAFNRVDSGAVRGIYLEDNVVATDGQYTIRAPRVYYDLTTNKAVVLEAVMYTWDIKRQIPLYVRAERIHQVARDRWMAQEAQVTTSEFAVPHLAIASKSVTLHEVTGRDGAKTLAFVGEGNRIELLEKTVLPLPRVAGQGMQTPIRQFEPVGFSSQVGFTFRSRWDLFALAGEEAPEGVDLEGIFDVLGDHGPAVGIEFNYDLTDMFGRLDAYGLLWDNGEDEIAKRQPRDHDDDQRGYAHWQHRQYLPDNWELSLQAAVVSDPTFLTEIMEDQADQVRQYETSIYLKKQENDWAFTFLTKYDLNSFTTQDTTFQAPGYVVDKLPELGFYQIGTGLWDDRLTYYTENRVSRMTIRPGHDTFADRGLTPPAPFGVDTRFEDVFSAAGVPQDYRSRFDSRHEVQAPLEVAGIDVVPYAVGRFTGYDQDFDEFNRISNGASEDDQYRLWGEVGLRLHTQFNRTFDDVDSRIFDVHRLRHIVEPYADISVAAANLEQGELPIYDANVEGIREGMTTRFGVRNTFQTQRGGPGRWRSVDWLTMDSGIVLTDSHTPTDPLGGDHDLNRYYGYRPEYSLGGDHLYNDLAWLISNNLAAVHDLTYDLDSDQLDQWRVGLNLQHAPQLTSFVDYIDLDAVGSRLLRYGFSYEMTVKYDLYFSHTLDLADGGSRELEMALVRKLPRWLMVVSVTHDEIDNDTAAMIRLVPQGLAGSRYARRYDRGGLFE